MESKHDKFIRLRNSRMKIFKQLMRLFSNFSNKSNYQYSVEEVNSLCDEMEADIKALREILLGGRRFKMEE